MTLLHFLADVVDVGARVGLKDCALSNKSFSIAKKMFSTFPLYRFIVTGWQRRVYYDFISKAQRKQIFFYYEKSNLLFFFKFFFLVCILELSQSVTKFVVVLDNFVLYYVFFFNILSIQQHFLLLA